MSTKVKTQNICPKCNLDRNRLQEMLDEPDVYGYWTDGVHRAWLKSDNHVKAETVILRCPACREHFGW